MPSKTQKPSLYEQKFFIGWLSFPHLTFIETIAPVIELLGLLCMGMSAYLGVLSIKAFIVYAFLIYALSGFYAWYSIYISDSFFKNHSSIIDVLKIGLTGLIEPLGYRQRDAFWRLIAWWKWLLHTKKVW